MLVIFNTREEQRIFARSDSHRIKALADAALAHSGDLAASESVQSEHLRWKQSQEVTYLAI
jgi:hypothetical protein